MHANGVLLNRLFTALGEHNHLEMASCYHPKARFRDIAFDLRGVEDIYDMWRMICTGDGDIKVKVEAVEADDSAGLVKLVDNYTISRSKLSRKRHPVHNVIESRFRFKDGLILRQDDRCDAREWARQALGHGPFGFLAGRIRLLRSFVATAKLAKFVRTNPE
jgi:uncharacterized protein